MARSVDTITPARRRPAAKSAKPKSAAPVKPAPIIKVAAPKSKRTPVHRAAVPAARTPHAPPSPKPAPQLQDQERRRRLLIPLVAGSFIVILALWASFGAAMHPRTQGDTFIASFVKNLNWPSIKLGWENIFNHESDQEREIRKAEKEIFPQFEQTITTK